ncbi:hypothetical protein B0J14DRAFT_557124 [Halenospora varia]|nr:hypothetical protein B0J14DRAFT_557124 [Halenospora varia]
MLLRLPKPLEYAISGSIRFVYQHAYCNIAATHASNSHDGLFCSRDPRNLSLHLKFGYESRHDTFQVVHEQNWEATVNHAPLNRRGWVIQERLISPRIIHFASEEVLWDCCISTTSERFPSGLNKHINDQSSKKDLTPHLRLEKDDSQRTYWALVVQEYSRCSLSYPDKDRIIAISALAGYFQALWKDEYCAGLWRKNLLQELCWEIEKPVSLDCTPTLLRAPTWSWLSFHGSIRFLPSFFVGDEFVNDLALVVEVDIRQEILEADVFSPKTRERPIDGRRDNSRAWNLIRFDYSDGRCGRLFCIVLCGKRVFFCMLVRLVDEASGAYVRCGSAAIHQEGMNEGLEAFQSLKGKEMLPCVEFDEKEGHLIKLL